MSEYVVEEPSDSSASWRVREEIVRCRDCKSMQRDKDYYFCMLAARELESVDGFCAWGERRSDDSD